MPHTKQTKGVKKVVLEYAEAIVTALILALFIRAYVVQAFKIPSGSMEPTLLVGDHILVNKFVYGTTIPFTHDRVLVVRRPQRGDVIVFRYPRNPSRDFIKRVVGVPGDVITGKDKMVYIDGKRAPDSFTMHVDSDVQPASLDPRDNFGPIVVPPGEYFVMGDNRDESYDSRYWGFVPRQNILGEAFLIYWSWNGIKEAPRLG
ncbi:MAG: signal peptidase I, partial [Nitrospiraceae bacterium]|nr:signal peptidase I [Nitrospiraceae bacterium]